MKENYIKKIRTLGKVGNIVTIVADVIIALSIVISLIGATVLVVMPKETFQMGIGGEVKMSMDLSGFGVKLTPEEQEDIISDMDEGQLEINGTDVEPDEVMIEATEGGFIITVDSGMYMFSLKDIGVLLYTAVIYEIMTLVTFIFAGMLCRAFGKCESPFDTKVIRKMQVLAWSLVPWTIIGSIVSTLQEFVFTGKLNIAMGIEFGVVFVVVLILVMTYIFKYGAMLQQESDETL